MPPADPSLSLAQQLDELGDRFESEWRAGKRPRIEDYLAALPATLHEVLLRGLLPVELELLAREGQRPAEADYQRRFPAHKSVVTSILAERKAQRAGTGETSVSHESARTGPFSPTSPFGSPEPLLERIGRFQVVSVLGEGAFGRVYKANDPELGRAVAIKVPFDAAVQTVDDRQRFLREARAAATISHPNVCPVHEVGEADGKPYIVMALIPGQSLAEVVKARKEPLPAKQIAVIVRKLATALDLAHKKGVVHRDLKPANVMFDRERKDVIVTDFGLARAPRLADGRATQSGVIMGTPAYMSPEQARGTSRSVGPATDIYALGVILYELLTGRRPFEGSITEVIGQILHVEPEPPSKHRPGIDPRLEAACLKAMAKEPAARFASMKEFAAAMEAIVRGPGPAAPSAEAAQGGKARGKGEEQSSNLASMFAALSDERKQARVETAAVVEAALAKQRTPRWLIVLAGLILLGGLAALGGIVFFTRSDKVKVTIELTDVDLSDKTLSFFLDEEPISAEALANPIELKPGDHVLVVKRGRQIVKRMLFTVVGGRSPGIRVRNITPPPPPPIRRPPTKSSPLDMLRAEDIPEAVLTKVYGGRAKAPPELVAVYPNLRADAKDDYHGMDVASDGRTLAVSRYPWDMIEMLNLANGRRFIEIGVEEPRHENPFFYWIRFSPDGKIIYGLRKNQVLYAFEITGKQLWRTTTKANWSLPAVSPDGSILVTADKNSNALRVLDARTGAERAQWPDVLPGPTYRLAFAPDGKSLAITSARDVLKVVDVKDGSVLKTVHLSDIPGAPSFRHDGKAVFVTHAWRIPENYFEEVNLSTGKTREYRLPPNGCRGVVANPAFPILVSSDRRENIHFWDADAGPDQKPLIISVGCEPEKYQFTPEGRYLIVGCDNGIFVFRLPVERKVAAWRAAGLPAPPTH